MHLNPDKISPQDLARLLTQMDATRAGQVIKQLARQAILDQPRKSSDHDCVIHDVRADHWALKELMAHLKPHLASDSLELETALATEKVDVILIPQGARLTAPIIDRLCKESSAEKTILWVHGD